MVQLHAWLGGETVDAQARLRLSWGERLLLAFVLVASLVVRLNALDVFLTVDEPNWHDRSVDFRQALLDGRFEDTYRSAHPGVVTMWVGVAAASIVDATLGPEALVRANLKGQGIPPVTVWARRFIAAGTWLSMLAILLLVRRLYGSRAMLLAGVLIALDPLFTAHSRFHHLDAILTVLCTSSVLALTAHLRGKRSLPLLCLSGATAGLAALNKAPGMFLAPWALVAIGVTVWPGTRADRWPRVRRGARDLAVWAGCAGLAAVVAWPALWANPMETLQAMVAGALEEGTQPHAWSNYFWFERREDPGPGFYPVAWALRTTVPVMLGLLGLSLRRRDRARRLAPLWLFCLGFAALMALSPKKFDRYLLPIFPLVCILAGIGWERIIVRGEELLRRPSWALHYVSVGLLLASVQLALLLPAWPYYLSYYNPLFGGGEAAAKILLVGWGEVMDQAAAYLNAKPNAEALSVATDMPGEFTPLFHGESLHIMDRPVVEPDYFVFYISHDQRDFVPSRRRLFDDLKPEVEYYINDILYARLYRNAVFEAQGLEVLDRVEKRVQDPSEMVLVNADLALMDRYEGDLVLKKVIGPPRTDFYLTQLESATRGQERVWFLSFPDVHDATADIVDDLLDEHSTESAHIEVDGVVATCYELDDDARFVGSPSARIGARVGDGIALLGYDLPRTEWGPGDVLPLSLYWQHTGPIEHNLKVFTHLVGPDREIYGQADSVPQGGAWPTLWWHTGDVVVDDYAIPVDGDAPAGEYTLYVGMYDMGTQARMPVCSTDGACLAEDRYPIRGLRVAP